MEAARPTRTWTFRVENIPSKTTAEILKGYFHKEDRPHIKVRSIVPDVGCEDFDGQLTATILFQTRDGTITAPRILDDTDDVDISVDSDFYGFTPLSQPKGPIAADIIAVTGLAAHAFGSWAHSSSKMWLRDYLPKDVGNARVLIYGYPSQLQGSTSCGIIADYTKNFVNRLSSMRNSARCQDRPIIFIGYSLGCLIIKKALSDVNGYAGRHSSNLPVRAIIFFGAPHRGLHTTALKTLVKSQPTEEMISELQPESPTLTGLNENFIFVADHIDILTCYELLPTKTAVQMPDGSWKREGELKMMVRKDSAKLGFRKEIVVSCNTDHGLIAKLRLGEGGPYPDVRMMIKQALSQVAEEQANVGLSRLQFQSGVKAVVEERPRHNGDYIKGSGPERTPVPAGKSPLNDAQSQGSSISEPAEKTARVLHDKEVVSAPSPPASDVRENGFIVQNKQAVLGPTVTPPSTQIMSRDDKELPKGDKEALKAFIQRATDASLDRRNALSSPMKKKSPDKAIGSVKDPKLRSKLCTASKDGDVDKVRSLLAQGCSIHESSEDLVDPDRDAFLLAALNGRLAVLKVLIQDNCDASKRDLSGDMALHLISSDPEIKPKPVIESLVILLLEHGVPIDARNSDGNTPLIWSAYNGKMSIAECLLDHGADIHSMDKNDSTALHWAADKGQHEIVALLISKGANIHCINNIDRTALHYGALNGHYEIVALLISKGADIHSTDNDGYTALHWAAFKDHHEIVALLISKGARLESRTKKYSYTPLHVSCLTGNGRGESVKLLLEAGADKGAISGSFSTRALHMAAQEGNLEVVNELLALGVEIDAPANDDNRALHYAKQSGHWRIIEALLAKGANPLLSDKYGNRALKDYWLSEANISSEDKEKCMKLLRDGEKAWKEKRRQERNE